MKKTVVCCILLLGLFSLLNAEDYKIESVSLQNSCFYPLYKILNTLHLDRQFDPYTQRIIIQDQGRYLTFFIEEDVVYYERQNIYLEHSSIRHQGKIYISEEMVKLITDWKRGDYQFSFKSGDVTIDKKQEVIYTEKKEEKEDPEDAAVNTDIPDNNVKVVYQPKTIPHKIKVIVIDPGHGGLDPGAIGQKGLREKDVVLQVSTYLKSELKKRLPNIKVVMCRDTDKYVSLQDRAKMANGYLDKDTSGLFISVHANASLNKKSSGTETFVLSPVASDIEARAVAAMENGIVGDNANKKEVDPVSKILSNMLSYEYIRESIQLATFLQNTYADKLGEQNVNRGIKKALFSVLEGTFMPGVLTEIGFITNKEEEKLFRKDWYNKKIASSIADGMIQFINWYEANNGFIQ